MCIHIALATDDNYAVHCATTIASVLSYNTDVFFHILHSGLSEKNIMKLENTVDNLDFFSEIEFIDMRKFDFSAYPMNRSHISIATYYRLALHRVLPKLSKVLYLDCDLLVLDNLKELYNIDLNYQLSAVAAVKDETDNYHKKRLGIRDYFNAGVSLLNLEFLRYRNASKEYQEILVNDADNIECQDQDIMNIAFNGRVTLVPMEYNANSTMFHPDIFTDASYSVAEERRAKHNPKILHFTGEHKPWQFTCCHPLKSAYLKYLMRTDYKFEAFKQLCLTFVSSIFKIDKTFKTFAVKLFGLEVFKIYGNRHKSIHILSITIN